MKAAAFLSFTALLLWALGEISYSVFLAQKGLLDVLVESLSDVKVHLFWGYLALTAIVWLLPKWRRPRLLAGVCLFWIIGASSLVFLTHSKFLTVNPIARGLEVTIVFSGGDYSLSNLNHNHLGKAAASQVLDDFGYAPSPERFGVGGALRSVFDPADLRLCFAFLLPLIFLVPYTLRCLPLEGFYSFAAVLGFSVLFGQFNGGVFDLQVFPQTVMFLIVLLSACFTFIRVRLGVLLLLGFLLSVIGIGFYVAQVGPSALPRMSIFVLMFVLFAFLLFFSKAIHLRSILGIVISSATVIGMGVYLLDTIKAPQGYSRFLARSSLERGQRYVFRVPTGTKLPESLEVSGRQQLGEFDFVDGAVARSIPTASLRDFGFHPGRKNFGADGINCEYSKRKGFLVRIRALKQDIESELVLGKRDSGFFRSELSELPASDSETRSFQLIVLFPDCISNARMVAVQELSERGIGRGVFYFENNLSEPDESERQLFEEALQGRAL